MGKYGWIMGLALMQAGTAHATCWAEASSRYAVPIPLLQAIAEVESSNRARVVARNTNGSLDYGFMQINSSWLPTLARQGIGVDELMNPCTSLHVGAWILAQNFQQMGYGWEAVGAYGAGVRKSRAAARVNYARKVWKALDRKVMAATARHHHPPATSRQGAEAAMPAADTAPNRHGILTVDLE